MEQRYTAAGISVDDLSAEIDKVWKELGTNPQLRKQAADAGIDVSALPPTVPITVRREGAGLDPATTAIVVAFAPVAAKIASDVWTHIILPRIKRQKGEDALKPK